jgi:hypothetical protein
MLCQVHNRVDIPVEHACRHTYAGQEDVRFALRTLRDRLVSFRRREENWDGRGSAASASKAIDDALAWIEEIYTATQAVDSGWFPPV